MTKSKQPFEEPFYQDMQLWLKRNRILENEVPIVKKEVEKYIFAKLRPIERQILFDDNLITVGGHLTSEFLHWLVRLETWDFGKKK